jgi:flagellar biosynthesis protein FlhB
MTCRSSRTRRWLARCTPAVDLDETVPVEHYKAVAEVIGFVLRTRRRRA